MVTAKTQQASRNLTKTATLSRELSLRDGTSLVVGTVIGSGIFLVPGPIARQLHSLSAVLLIWIVGGVLSLCGALSLGELAHLCPRGGGLYAYLREAYGDRVAFLYGWSLFAVIQSGTIATLCSGFGLYLSNLIHLQAPEQRIVAIGCVILLTGLNCVGLAIGKLVQNAGTFCKVVGILALVSLLFSRGHIGLLRNSLPFDSGFGASLPAYGIALTAVLWGYEGWHLVSFVTSEFHNPQRDLPRSLAVGTCFCIAIYLLLTIAYYSVLTVEGVQGSDHVAATALDHAYGNQSVLTVSILIMVSILAAANGNVLTGPRVYYAMAEDGLFFRPFQKISARFRTPTISLCAQGAWACLLILTGSFQQLFTSVIFTAWFFYALAVCAVIVLRFRRPNLPRGFLAPASPWMQLTFIFAAVGIIASTVVSEPSRAVIGACVVLAGIPVYQIAFRKQMRSNPDEA